MPRPPTSTLFPYTTLFRSLGPSAPLEDLLWEALKDPQCGLSMRSEEHTSELQSRVDLVCRLLLEKKNRRSAHTRRRARTPARSQASSKTRCSRPPGCACAG